MELLEKLNSFISDHQELFTLIMVPILTLSVTALLNRSAERRAEAERRLEREVRKNERLLERELARKMKLADFRQGWIDGLREDVATFISITLQIEKTAKKNADRVNHCMAKIQMRLNPNEPLALDLIDKLQVATKTDEVGDPQTQLLYASQKLLKVEWDKLRNELSEIENLGINELA